MQGLITALLRVMIRVQVKPVLGPPFPIAAQRVLLRLSSRLMRPPRGSEIANISMDGVPAERVRCGNADAGAILYLHGGAYVAGGPDTHRSITGRLARSAQARVFAIDYRLAPEHPFPAALEDAIAAYRWLLERGNDPKRIVIAGDSAGGGLTVATALKLRDEGVPLPAALLVFSPWLDLTCSEQPDPELARKDIMIRPAWIRQAAALYRGCGAAEQPLVSPLYAELHGLPPTLIQVGTHELLLPDSEKLAARMQAAGTEAQLQVYPEMWHVFQIHGGWLRRADEGLQRAADFITQRWRTG